MTTSPEPSLGPPPEPVGDLSPEPKSKRYEFEGIPLTPNVMASVAMQIFSPNAMVRRQKLLDDVVAFHFAHGGIGSQANPVSQIKKALAELSSAGEIESTGAYGLWRFTHVPDIERADENEVLSEMENSDPEAFEEVRLEVQNTSREGSGCVYVYYFPGYFREGLDFPMKIGMSAGSCISRIVSQLGTSNPEDPVIYRLIKTESPRLIESYLHSVLTLRGCHLDDASGSEWFNTRPETIDDLLRYAGLLDDETSTHPATNV